MPGPRHDDRVLVDRGIPDPAADRQATDYRMTTAIAVADVEAHDIPALNRIGGPAVQQESSTIICVRQVVFHYRVKGVLIEPESTAIVAYR